MGVESKNESTKKKRPKKKKIFVEHRPLVVGSIIAVAAIAGIVGGVIFYRSAPKEEKDTLTWTYEGLWWYDTLLKPQEIMNMRAYISTRKVLLQIAEGLFEYEITNEYTHIVPNLALDGYWSADYLNFTCSLREGVKFHDGTPFNAYAVKWTFDRLHNLLSNMIYPDIWYDSDGKLILNRTEIIDNYTVRFVLNRRFGPFKVMLCFYQSYILSPSAAPANDFIEIDTNLIGTGPFKYDSSTFQYDPVNELNFTSSTTLLANPDYWDGPPKLDVLIFKVIMDDEERYEKLLSGEIQLTDLNPWGPENFTSHPGISINCFNTSIINFLAIKNNLVNATMRKALSYAINYTKLLEFEALVSFWGGGNIRTRSPLSKGMLFSNWKDFELPYYNITIARQVLKDVNWNGTAGALTANDNITAGNEWESLVTNGTPLAIYNFSYSITYIRQIFYRDLLVENFKQIGIEINPILVVEGEEYKIPWSHFRIFGWIPDYNDPHNNISPLFSSKADGFANWGQVNDTLVQQWMEAGLIETNETARAQYYYDIQECLIEVVYPCIWTYTERGGTVHASNLGGINYNLWPYKELLKDAHFY